MQDGQALADLVGALRHPGNRSRLKGDTRCCKGAMHVLRCVRVADPTCHADALEALGSGVNSLPLDLQRAVELYALSVSSQVCVYYLHCREVVPFNHQPCISVYVACRERALQTSTLACKLL